MNFDIVKSLIGFLAENIDLVVIRSEQGGKQPAYPYGVYKVSGKNNGDYRSWKEIAILDPTKYKEEFSRLEEFTISLSFVNVPFGSAQGTNLIDGLWTLADKAYDYLNVISRDRKQELGITVELLNAISDRTVYLDPVYEYKVGFDFKIKGVGKLERTLDAIDIDATVEGIVADIE